MLESYSTHATVAKIRSIYGRMLTREDMRELLAKRSVAEVADHLCHTPRFAEAMRDVDPNTVHRGMLERLLFEHNFDTYMRLTSFQGLENKPFYDFLIKQNECVQLINLVNAVNNGLQDSFVNALPGYVIKTSKLKFLQLAKSENIGELTAALKGTKYYKLFLKIKRQDDGRADFTDAEVRLRTAYYKALLQDVKDSFSGSERDELNELIKGEIDFRNIINAYRLKAYFGYSPDEIRATLLPFSKQGRHTMNKLYDAEDAAEMLSLIRRMSSGRYVTEDMDSIESGLRLKTLTVMKHVIAKTNFAPIALYAFMFICDNELRNIYRVIESVRYDMDSAVIDQLIVM